MKTNGAGRPKRSVTAADIARLCGVSRVTVSAVLNGKRTVRESTRTRVLNCIREQNYASGIIAKALVGELSGMIAVLVPALGSPYQMMVFQGLNEVLRASGYHVLLHNILPEGQADSDPLAGLKMYRPGGYLMLRGAEGRDGENVRKIIEDGVPLVAIGAIKGTNVHSVKVDERMVMRIAADYAVQKGHHRLGYMAGPSFLEEAKERRIGFIESMLDHDIPMSDIKLAHSPETAAAGYEAALVMLRNPAERPTVVVCFNDMLALGVYRAAQELSLNIPRDLSVIGSDGIDLFELLGPPLTTVDTCPVQQGKFGAELLIRAMRNEVGRNAVTEWIPPRLLERASVRSF